MIVGIGGLALHLWLILGLSLVMAALVIAMMQKHLLSWLDNFNLIAKQRFMWCIALFPYAIGLYVATLIITPPLSHQLGLASDHGHFHYPQGHFHWLSWQGLCVLLLSIMAIWKLIALALRRLKQDRFIKTLLTFSEVDSRGCYKIESAIPNAFTLGLLKPKILISSALENALSDKELDIVYRHELAHQQARDPLKLWIFHRLLGIFIPAAARQLVQAMELLIEQQADAVVANQFRDPSFIASTLVKVNRLALRYQHSIPDGIACCFCTTAIEARIRQLLNNPQGQPFPLPHFLLIALILISIGAYCASSLHHSIEILLHYHPN